MRFDDNFPKRLASARNAAGLTQANLASMAETVVRQIAAYEGGEARPRLKTLQKIASALGTSIDWLCEGIGAAPTSDSFSRIRNIRQIPILSEGIIDEFISDDIIQPGVKMHPCDLDVSDKAFAFKVRGDSMHSSGSNNNISLPNGTIVIVDPLREFVSGDIALISQDNDLVRVKKIIVEHGYANIISLNRIEYPTEACLLADIDYIYPVVKAEIYLNKPILTALAWEPDFLPPISVDKWEDEKNIIFVNSSEKEPNEKYLQEFIESQKELNERFSKFLDIMEKKIK
ncbi:TPA: helix-turn-helix domain-containing protein [Providencia rettgeri]